jgi:hypothetical protein
VVRLFFSFMRMILHTTHHDLHHLTLKFNILASWTIVLRSVVLATPILMPMGLS